jgi:anti-anti-sigma factor
MHGMTVSIEAERGRMTRISLAGELDIETADEFDTAVRRCLDAPSCKQVRVNLAEVTFCDSTGLGALAAVSAHCEQNGTEFVIENPHARVVRVIALTGMEAVFKIEP